MNEKNQLDALWYRFGMLAKKPEMAFPDRGEKFLEVFAADFERWAKGSYSAISFARGEFSYTIYSRHAVFEEDERSNGSGIRIRKAGVEVADLRCDSDRTEDAMQKFLYESGLKQTKHDAL